MAYPHLERVFSHWDRLFENFTASSDAFYNSVEEVIERLELPGVDYSRVKLQQDAFASREYLRVKREDTVIDICAAPFGPHYFFSAWLWRKSNYGALVLTLLILWTAEVLWFVYLGRHSWARVFTLLILAALTVLLARLFHRLANRLTYYKIDAMIMFQKSVSSAVFEVLDGLTKAKGLRALTEEERKPVYRALIGR